MRQKSIQAEAGQASSLSTESKAGIVAGVDWAKGTMVGDEVSEEIGVWWADHMDP